MTRLESLRALKEAVEAGMFAHDPHEHGMPERSFNTFGKYSAEGLAYDAYNGSLDAARALHEAVLPSDHQWFVGSFRDGRRSVTFKGECHVPCPARAWLIAILSALIAQEATDDAP